LVVFISNTVKQPIAPRLQRGHTARAGRAGTLAAQIPTLDVAHRHRAPVLVDINGDTAPLRFGGTKTDDRKPDARQNCPSDVHRRPHVRPHHIPQSSIMENQHETVELHGFLYRTAHRMRRSRRD
jgi:hypothetical protein